MLANGNAYHSYVVSLGIEPGKSKRGNAVTDEAFDHIKANDRVERCSWSWCLRVVRFSWLFRSLIGQVQWVSNGHALLPGTLDTARLEGGCV